jgi:mannitol/fructose-specific phosphotransferase system IIA component
MNGSAPAPLLRMENIVLNLPTESREQAIRRCGALLLAGGYVTKRYIQGMFARDSELNTAIGNFIAIPHGKKEYKKEILSPGLAVLGYPGGIIWRGVPVHLVIGIAAWGGEHLDILGNIADRLITGEDVLKLAAGADKQEIYDLFLGTAAG